MHYLKEYHRSGLPVITVPYQRVYDVGTSYIVDVNLFFKMLFIY